MSGKRLPQDTRRDLRDVQAVDSDAETRRKLAAVDDAARHEFPTADIEQMLAEIEQGTRYQEDC